MIRTSRLLSISSRKRIASPTQLGNQIRDKALWATKNSFHDENNVNDGVGVSVNDGTGFHLKSIKLEIEKIHEQAKALNNYTDINLNSPKQVADALYRGSESEERGTGKNILQSFVSYDPGADMDSPKATSFQRELASLVLQYRELKHELQLLQRDEVGTNRLKSSNSNKMRSIPNRSMSTEALSTVAKSTIQNMGNNNNNIQDQIENDEVNTSHQHYHSTTAEFRSKLQSLFSSTSEINDYWKEPLQNISKPSARALIFDMNPSCPMGYDPKTLTGGKQGSLLSYVREQKSKYSDCIILTRVGEFYEAYGIDALLLIEHCGLNGMGDKARAGCPLQNIQATLDGLTTVGYRVAVYEETADTDASLGGKGISGGPKARLKNRMLAQIVSPASPTYLYNLVLGDDGSTSDALFGTPSARPYAGVISNAAGYTLVEVSSEERTVRVSERLTAEAVACQLSAYPPAEPLMYVPFPGEETKSLPFLPSYSDLQKDGPGAKSHVRRLQPHLYMPNPRRGVSDIERAKQCIVNALLKEISTNGDNSDSLSNDDFVLFPTSKEMANSNRTTTNPLYLETATQLGLMHERTIPELVKYLLPDSAPLPTKRFLRRWLLTPPPPDVSKAMSELILTLKNDNVALPPMTIPPVGKILSLIRVGQASAQVFRDILVSIDSTVSILDMYSQDPDIVSPLMVILRYESGIDAQPNNLRERCLDAMQIISDVVCTHSDKKDREDRISSNCNGIISSAFFERNEAAWRGRIKPENAKEAYERVRLAAEELLEAIAVDFWGTFNMDDISPAKDRSKSPVAHDIFNNLLCLKELPLWASGTKKGRNRFYHPHDRNGKLLKNRYTTARVENAVSSYVEACELATESIKSVLTKLSETLCESGHLPSISQTAHSNLILSTASQHAAEANRLGWNMATINEPSGSENNATFQFRNVWPYWMDKSESVLNSFDLNGMFLLTAPNMSGKSTIMRTTAAAALLSNCGLCAPFEKGNLQRFDNIFVRGASSDVPTENKSAFGAEMQDIAALLRACGNNSIVFVDELGRGTSPKDGTALAAAVLEEMASSGMKGFFATHLHSILNLQMKDEAKRNIFPKRMEVLEDSWTYRLVDGVCTDSQALKTAAKFGIPSSVIQRAAELSLVISDKNDESSPLPKRQISSSNEEHVNAFEKFDIKTLEDQIETVNKIVKHISGQSATHIPPNWTPPPSLEGFSVLYVIIVGDRYYVGETNSLAQRLRQHRSKSGWSNINAIAVKVDGGKTVARNLESLLIRKFVSEGLSLVSVKDGQTIRPLNRKE